MVKSRSMRCAGHEACMGEMESGAKTLARKHEEKRSLGKFRLGWEENFAINIEEIGFKGVNWMHLAQDRDQ
jgi:hypothetical protein